MRVGAYSLCYMEGALLAANITLMYEKVDKFVIVIGQVEVSETHKGKVDEVSRIFLEQIKDPFKKLTIIESNFFESKDEMTYLAQEALDTEIVIQLDSDEFWSKKAFDAAITEIENGANRVLIPHKIYFRGSRHILSSRDLGDFYFVPPRMWLKVSGSKIGHFSGIQTVANSQIENVDSTLDHANIIHHLGWVQRKQIQRKLWFYSAARNYDMPSYWKLIMTWRITQLTGRYLNFGPNVVRIKRMSQQGIPTEIQKVISEFKKAST